MTCSALSYFTASPNATSSLPIGLVVSQPASAHSATPTIRMRLEDMAIILFETGGLVVSHAARCAQGRGRRRWRNRRECRRRHSAVGPAIEDQVALVRWAGVVGRLLERSRRDGPNQPRRDDDDEFSLIVL